MDTSTNRTDIDFLLFSPHVLCIAGSDGLIKLVNPRFVDATGWSEDEVLGKPFIDMIHPDELNKIKTTMSSLVDSTTPIHIESKLLCKDNTYRWFSWDVIKKGVLYYSVGTDITEQRQNDAITIEPKNIEIDYKKIIESVFDQIVITDPEGIILFANGATEAITGFSKSEIIGSKAGKQWGGHMPGEFYTTMWTTIKNDKKPFIGKIQNKRKNGQSYDAEVRIVPILTNDNAIQYFVGIERDISKENELVKLTQIALSREIKMSELKDQLEKMKTIG